METSSGEGNNHHNSCPYLLVGYRAWLVSQANGHQRAEESTTSSCPEVITTRRKHAPLVASASAASRMWWSICAFTQAKSRLSAWCAQQGSIRSPTCLPTSEGTIQASSPISAKWASLEISTWAILCMVNYSHSWVPNGECYLQLRSLQELSPRAGLCSECHLKLESPSVKTTPNWILYSK